MMERRIRCLGLLALAGILALSGCVVAAGGAVLGGAVVATDRRSVGMQIEDAQIEHRISSALDEHFSRESVRIDVTSFDQKVLLAGQVPHEPDRGTAEAIATGSQDVRQVINEITIGTMAGLASRTDDSALVGKVRAAMLAIQDLPAGAVKVSCTDGSIYLFGRVNVREADVSKRAASRVNGVKRVVALFDVSTDPVPASARAGDTAAVPAPAAK
jgi:osmotically-inducible protein OsmY